MAYSFIIIDENELDCFIVKKIISSISYKSNIKAFVNPEIAFKHIKLNGIEPAGDGSVIFLDLRMPFMDGFQFLDKFNALPHQTREKFFISILSSTQNSSDLLRLKAYTFVKCILEKPLTKDKFKFLLRSLDMVN